MKAERKIQRWGAKTDVDARRDLIMRGLNTVLRSHRRPHSLRMQDVADHLGLVKGNLYYYFKNKDELIYHCHIKCVEASLAALDRARQSAEPVGKRLHTLIVEHILAMTEGDYSAVLRADIDEMSPPRRRSYVKLRDAFEGGVRDLIKQGISAGDFAKQDARLAGFAILGAINWIPKWYEPDGELDAKTIAQRYADLFVRALKA
jgi:AcrR family transcriptional regulator